MRLLVILLLFANIAFFGHTRLERMNEGEPARMANQLQPEKLKLLTPPQVANLGPAKAAQLNNVCLEWGAFTDAERPGALAALEPLQLGRQLTQRRTEGNPSYWVFIPPLATRPLAERKVAELRALGLTDYFILNDGPQKNAISLGIFKTEEAAGKYHDAIKTRGVNSARIGPRAQTIGQTTLVLRDPQPAQAERVQQLKNDFAGSEVKIGPCDRS
jgi:hypothetical protein